MRILRRMAPADDAARALLEYDEAVARQVLDLIVRELGGGDEDPRSFLARIDPPEVRTATSTAEWKLGFAQYERLRELGLALAQRVR